MTKPKLAPIASCETLTDCYEVSAALSSAESSSVSSSSPRHSVSDDSCAVTPITIISSASSQPHHQSQQQQQHRPATATGNTRRLQLTPNVDLLSDELRESASSDTLVPGSPRGRCVTGEDRHSTSPTSSSSTQSLSGLKRSLAALLLVNFRAGSTRSSSPFSSHQLNALALSPATSPKFGQAPSSLSAGPPSSCDAVTSPGGARRATSPSPLHRSPQLQRASSPISYSYSSPNIITNLQAKSRSACT